MPIAQSRKPASFLFFLPAMLLLICTLAALPRPLAAAKHSNSENPLIMSLDAPESDVLQALRQVLDDQIVHGTQQYAKEKILYGAHAAPSSSVLPDPQEGGKVFYKVAEHILAPTTFNESSAVGTITVRYVVQPQSAGVTNIRIDAVYVEDDRRAVHHSEGVVESAEFAELKKRLEELQARRNQDQRDATKLAELQAEDEALSRAHAMQDTETPVPGATVVQLENRVQSLRREVERKVKSPGSELKSAPFRSASTVLSLPAETEVVVVVITPYWLGVETADGHRGWMHRSQLESLP
jgi:hypothetical protein